MARAPVIIDRSLFATVARPSPVLCYSAVSVLLFGIWVRYYIFDPFGFDNPYRDTWHHVAVLRELMVAPFDPSNPHIATMEPSRYFTPVNVAAALFGRVLRLSPYTLFGFIGAASCVGFVTGCWLFARRYYASPWAPHVLLLSLLFAWGLPRAHTGLHNYATLLSSAAYPATIVFVLGLFFWVVTLAALDDDLNRKVCVPALSAFGAVVLLVHQLSGAIVVTGAGSLVLFHPRADLRAKATLLGAIGVGCLSTLIWPYFNIIDVLSSVSDTRWRSADADINKVSMALTLAAPALVGILGFKKAEGGWRWEILLPTVLFGAAYALLCLQGSPIAHRLAPAIILFAQLGLVWVVLDYIGQSVSAPRTRLAIAGALFGFLAVAIAISSASRLSDLQIRASSGSLLSLIKTLTAHMPARSISFATGSIVFPLQSTGRRVVSIPRPEPAAPSMIARQAATDLFFAPGTSQETRRALIRQWHATHVVVLPFDLQPGVLPALRALGASKRFSHNLEVITVNAPAGAPQEKSR